MSVAAYLKAWLLACSSAVLDRPAADALVWWVA
jgi:hypothetical protein